MSDNFYWLSTHPDVSDWKASTWYYTPVKSPADLTALTQLPAVRLNVTSEDEQQGDSGIGRVTLENPSPHLAFLVHLEIRQGETGGDVKPVLWDDNYVSLVPGEKRTITARYRIKDLDGTTPVVGVDGWNVRP